MAYLGDTLLDVIDEEPVVRQAKLLIMEVTFLDDRVSVEACRGKGHIHLHEILAQPERLANNAILFVHFSARYTFREIREIVDERLPPGLRERVTVFLPRPG